MSLDSIGLHLFMRRKEERRWKYIELDWRNLWKTEGLELWAVWSEACRFWYGRSAWGLSSSDPKHLSQWVRENKRHPSEIKFYYSQNTSKTASKYSVLWNLALCISTLNWQPHKTLRSAASISKTSSIMSFLASTRNLIRHPLVQNISPGTGLIVGYHIVFHGVRIYTSYLVSPPRTY